MDEALSEGNTVLQLLWALAKKCCAKYYQLITYFALAKWSFMWNHEFCGEKKKTGFECPQKSLEDDLKVYLPMEK